MVNHGRPEEAHVAVLAFPFSSHGGSLLSVVRRLASSAPSTLFSFFSTHSSNRSLFAPAPDPSSNVRPYDVADGVPEGHVFTAPHTKHQEEIAFFMRAGPDAFRQGMGAAAYESGRKVTCVVSDAFLWYAEDIAAEMHLPWVSFWTSGPSSLAAHLFTDLIRHRLDTTKGIAGREDETLDFIPGMSRIRIKDLPEGVLFGNLESPFSRMLLLMGRSFPRATAVALNAFEALDSALTQHLSSNIPNLLSIGPLNMVAGRASPVPVPVPVPDEYGCLRWLDTRNPSASVAYIGFGSITVPPRSELMAIAEALEGTGVPFVWSLKEEFWDDRLPKGFLERTSSQGMVVPWAPQVDILSHGAVGAFVTHCGWGSFLEALNGGVPMICRPFFGDQRLNGRTIQDVLGIGVVVDGGVITRDGLATYLDLVLAGDDGRRMRENVKHLRLQAQEALATGSSAANFKKLLHIMTTPSS